MGRMREQPEHLLETSIPTEVIRIALEGFARKLRVKDNLQLRLYGDAYAEQEVADRQDALDAYLEEKLHGKTDVTVAELGLDALPPDLRSEAIDLLTDILVRERRRAEKPRTLEHIDAIRRYGDETKETLRTLLRPRKAA
jgi:hypothetical protein